MLRRAVLSVALCTLLATGALAQREQDSLEGRYQLAISRERAESIIHEAIEKATEEMGFIREQVGENRLEAKNPVLSAIAIELTETHARIQYGEHRFEVQRGSFGSLTTPDGESARARARVQGNRMIVDWRLDAGQRRDVFTREGDTLHFQVRITSEQLPEDVRYRLDYRVRS